MDTDTITRMSTAIPIPIRTNTLPAARRRVERARTPSGLPLSQSLSRRANPDGFG
jgi:hypothetical protein